MEIKCDDDGLAVSFGRAEKNIVRQIVARTLQSALTDGKRLTGEDATALVDCYRFCTGNRELEPAFFALATEVRFLSRVLENGAGVLREPEDQECARSLAEQLGIEATMYDWATELENVAPIDFSE